MESKKKNNRRTVKKQRTTSRSSLNNVTPRKQAPTLSSYDSNDGSDYQNSTTSSNTINHNHEIVSVVPNQTWITIPHLSSSSVSDSNIFTAKLIYYPNYLKTVAN
jgi:hypothetical protein